MYERVIISRKAILKKRMVQRFGTFLILYGEVFGTAHFCIETV